MDAAAWLRSVEDATAQTQKRLDELDAFLRGLRALDEIYTEAAARISEMMDAERVYVFSLDQPSNKLCGMLRAADGLKEIRIPAGPGSLSGFVAVAKVTVNLRNAYDEAELARLHPKLRFNSHLDRVSGSQTKSVLTVPILEDGKLVGVLQTINRRTGVGFMPRDVKTAEEIARVLAPSIARLVKAKHDNRRARDRWDGLVTRGVLNADALTAALKDAAAAKTDPSRHLIEKLGVSRAEVERSAAEFFGCEFHRFTGKDEIPAEIKARARQDFLKNIRAVPVEVRGTQIVIVIDDPSDITRTDALRSLDADRELVLKVGFRDEILACIEYNFGQRGGDVGLLLKEMAADDGAAGAEDEPTDDEAKDESDSAVIKLANQVILDAFRRGASDIHIEPNGKDRNTTIRFRVDGECVAYQDIPSQYRQALVARIKIMARLDISERRKPQDGKIRFRMKERQIELRVATLPTVNGNEDVVMRILAASKPMPLDKMGMNDRNVELLKKLVAKPYGLVLVVGPTGSGKTTTLHSALGYINTPDTKIWTAEDPVEITQPGLRQVQVQPKIGFDFATAMRAFLRADPDVIMVGEMRDHETASTGVEASLTGHLVMSTLHTNSAPETVTRLVDMGLDPFSFSDALLGVLAQRLARSLCPKCKHQRPANDDEFTAIKDAFGDEEVERRGYRPGTLMLSEGKGCEACGNTGYKGRLGIHELLVNDEVIKKAITRKAPVGEIRAAAIAGGMTTLLQDGIEKALAGKTDIKQVLAVCSR
jgi:type II secretory ATPase GspE/PulE/Tfp pilus assembly ATPase PilB-like protein/GAF domain-containing protein